jgi:ADP-glucose pyrophosphorylase
MALFRQHRPDHYLILAADQVYRMDFRELFHAHRESEAEITVACTPVSREKIYGLGAIKPDGRGKIADFVEKPVPGNRQISMYAYPAACIAEGSVLHRVILDEDARIGRNCSIGADAVRRADSDCHGYSIRDGVIVIHQGARGIAFWGNSDPRHLCRTFDFVPNDS